jgi:fructose-specific phosphotransferase system IIA component
MKITDLLSKETIKLNLESESKADVLIELATILENAGKLNDLDEFLEAVKARENEFSTGIGKGIAIPHAKTDAVKLPSLVFAKSDSGIDFDSADKKDSHLFFLIAVPEKSSNEHLKILSKLSRSLMHDELRESLMNAESKEEILQLLDQ